MKKIKTLSVIISFITLIYSCRKEDSQQSNLDNALKNVLTHASGNKGQDYYLLPESNDFTRIPQDPKNPLTADKVELGRFLYNETGLALKSKSPNGKYTFSCASCHHSRAGFQAGVPQGIGDGGSGFGLNGENRTKDAFCPTDSLDIQPIRSPTTLNSAYQELMLWNGQFGGIGQNLGTEDQWLPGTPVEKNKLGFHGLETQAIAGLTVHRLEIDSALVQTTHYKQLFDIAFPEYPIQQRYTKLTAGLAIAAYERTLLANRAPFQKWLRGNANALSDQEKKGAITFFSKGECYNCHNGPALNSMDFYALGCSDLAGPGVYGNIDAKIKKGRGGFTGNPIDDYKFKVPQLYSLIHSPFFGHGANFHSVYDIIEYKNNAVPQNPNVPESQITEHFKPLNLTKEEMLNITAFIERGLNDNELTRFDPVTLPSHRCFPNNDPQSKTDLNCN